MAVAGVQTILDIILVYIGGVRIKKCDIYIYLSHFFFFDILPSSSCYVCCPLTPYKSVVLYLILLSLLSKYSHASDSSLAS